MNLIEIKIQLLTINPKYSRIDNLKKEIKECCDNNNKKFKELNDQEIAEIIDGLDLLGFNLACYG